MHVLTSGHLTVAHVSLSGFVSWGNHYSMAISRRCMQWKEELYRKVQERVDNQIEYLKVQGGICKYKKEKFRGQIFSVITQ